MTEPDKAAVAVPTRKRSPRIVLFRLEGESFGVEGRYAKEVVQLDGLTPVPGTPSFLRGVANLRGLVLPVLEIGPLLGLAERKRDAALQALVVAVGSVWVSFLLDEVVAFEPYEPVDVVPLGEGQHAELLEHGTGLLKRQQGLFTVLDVPKIVKELQQSLGSADRGLW
jgi:purine-binding chemotaxis protein CheW